jgi:polyisoprenoid-binding protein YceI
MARHELRKTWILAGAVALGCILALAGSSARRAEADGATGKAGKYSIDPAASKLVVKTTSSGLLGGLGHDHQIRAVNPTGFIIYDPKSPASCSVECEVNTVALTVTDSDTSDDDKKQIRDNMMGSDVLYVQKFPTLKFKSTHVEDSWPNVKVTGMFNVRGLDHEVTLRVVVEPQENGTRLHCHGRFDQSLDKWMLHPPNAAGGAIQVDDTIAFDLEVIADLK